MSRKGKSTRLALLLAAPLLMAQAKPPLVPEGIHRDTNGPPELCGITAPDLSALERKVTTDPTFQEENSTTLYRVFIRERDFIQFVFPRAGTLGFRMATCRQVESGPDGETSMRRQLHCDGSRDQCDRIFLEFQALDQKVTGSLGDRT